MLTLGDAPQRHGGMSGSSATRPAEAKHQVIGAPPATFAHSHCWEGADLPVKAGGETAGASTYSPQPAPRDRPVRSAWLHALFPPLKAGQQSCKCQHRK